MHEKSHAVLRRRGLAALLAVAPLLATTGEPAAAERDWHAGVGTGYVALTRGAYSGPAIGLEGSLVYGLTDQFNALLEVSASPHLLTAPAPDPCPAAPASCLPLRAPYKFWLLTATTGLAYTLDVGRWVPYAAALVGVSRLSGGDSALSALFAQHGRELKLDAVLGGGLDYQLTKRINLGVAVRVHLSPLNRVSTTITQGYLRAQYSW